MIRITDRTIYAVLAFALGMYAIHSDYTPITITKSDTVDCSGMNSCMGVDR